MSHILKQNKKNNHANDVALSYGPTGNGDVPVMLQYTNKDCERKQQQQQQQQKQCVDVNNIGLQCFSTPEIFMRR